MSNPFYSLLLLIALVAFASPAGVADAERGRMDLTFGVEHVTVLYDGLDISQADLRAYVSDAALASCKIYGHMPVARTVIKIDGTDGDSVGFATSTYSDDDDCGLIELSLGRNTSRKTLNQSWTLTHEIIHLGFPIVERSKRWLAEGIATYEEPIGRLRMGMVDAEDVWGDMLRYAPTGLPPEGDRGLNYTRAWGRVYWGGALYCLLADVEIRKKTGNKFGLEHALRGIASSGGTAASDWSASQALEAGDQALGLTVLNDLYERMGRNPADIDLHQLWSQLGIKKTADGIVFDNRAPMASIRRAIESGS